MAREVHDRAGIGGFLRDLGCPPAAVEAAERLVAGGARGFESGWGRRDGVLVVGAAASPGGELDALVAAADERALRDLLLALPFGEPLRLRLGLDWHLGAAAELLDGHAAPGTGCLAGRRRGRAGEEAAGAPPLDRRHPVVELLRELARPAGRDE